MINTISKENCSTSFSFEISIFSVILFHCIPFEVQALRTRARVCVCVQILRNWIIVKWKQRNKNYYVHTEEHNNFFCLWNIHTTPWNCTENNGEILFIHSISNSTEVGFLLVLFQSVPCARFWMIAQTIECCTAKGSDCF